MFRTRHTPTCTGHASRDRLRWRSVAAGIATFVAVTTAGAAMAGSSAVLDYGDAPDGRPTGYGPTGTLPSLANSDGGRVADVNFARLGSGASREKNARLVNRDSHDDGVAVRLNRCKRSEAIVVVDVPAIAQQTRGTAYLNLFFDWDRKGQWAGADTRCGKKNPPPEWAVKNFAIDLDAQTGRQQVYRVPFKAGRVDGPLWYRATLTVDEPWQDGSGAGAYERGEVEDYLLAYPSPKDAKGTVTCKPRSLDHGKRATFRITASPVLGTIIGTRMTNRTAGVNATGTTATTRTRIIEHAGVARYRFTSTRVHDIRGLPVERDRFKVRVMLRRAGVTRTKTVKCRATVWHVEKKNQGGGVEPPKPPKDGMVQVPMNEFALNTKLTYLVMGPTSAELCVAIETDPKQPGVTYNYVPTGRGADQTRRERTLDASGRDSFRIPVRPSNLADRLPETYTVQVVVPMGIAFTFAQPMVEMTLDGSNCQA